MQATAMQPDSFIPMEDLDLMIALGWGDTPRTKIPENWRIAKMDDGTLARVNELEAERIALQPAGGCKVCLGKGCLWCPQETRGRAPHRRFFDRPDIQTRARRMRTRA